MDWLSTAAVVCTTAMQTATIRNSQEMPFIGDDAWPAGVVRRSPDSPFTPVRFPLAADRNCKQPCCLHSKKTVASVPWFLEALFPQLGHLVDDQPDEDDKESGYDDGTGQCRESLTSYKGHHDTVDETGNDECGAQQ